MYTNEQAKEALAKKFYRDMDIKINLMWHEAAIKEQAIYNLPYRILFNYFTKCHNRDFMEVQINPYYPYPDIPKEYKPPKWDYERDGGYTTSEWYDIIAKPTGEVTEDGKRCVTLETPADIKADIEKWQAEKVKERNGHEYKHIWDLTTAAGQQAWLYWFAVFLLPYADDIPQFSTFDMWGDTKHTEQELKERKRYYMGLIEQCKANPDIYKHEVQRKDIGDYEKYELEYAYMYDDIHDKPPQGDNALKIMYYERDRLKRFWGKEYKIKAEYEQYSDCYKVEQIIKRLEAEQGIKPD